MKSRKKLTTAIVILLIGAAVAGGWAYRNAKRYKHFAIHEQGKVYRSAWLEADAMAEMVHTYQLRSVVNLCKPGEMGEQRWIDERAAVEGAGAKLIELSMPLKIDPNDEPVIQQHIAVIRDPNNYPMLVHCQHGVTRTAKFLILYDKLIRDKSAQESLAGMPLFGRDEQNVHVRAYAKILDEKGSQDHSTTAAGNSDAARR